ncbi:MAG: phosphate propanoyltransferase [Thermoplasmata archaeon]
MRELRLGMSMIPAAISNRHVHLSREHIDILFGKGYELTKLRDLSQKGQFACNEKVDVVGSQGVLKGVRVLGPARKETQIEVSITDCFVLGVNPPVRMSGDIRGSAGGKLIGPKGEVEIKEGIIIAARHIHMDPESAIRLGIKDKEKVQVRVRGVRGLVFDETIVRVDDTFVNELHLDTDEGNAANIKNGDYVEIMKIR